jgi:putative membrane protein
MTEPNDRKLLAKSYAHFFRGLFMGLADAVPGVSGGTIALLLGIYHRLIGNIGILATCCGCLVRREFRSCRLKLRTVEWSFLIPLFIGIFLAFGILAHFIEDLLENYPQPMAGLFFGLVVVSVFTGMKMIQVWNYMRYGCTALVGGVTFMLLSLSSGQIQDPTLVHFFVGGMIAISAMVLPGISGSFLLLMIGMYAPLIQTVNDKHLLKLLVFGAGAMLSLGFSSKALEWLLKHQRDTVLACLIGLMLGSLRVLWPWPNGVGVISEIDDEVVKGTTLGWPDNFSDFFWPLFLACAGFILVLSILFFERRNQNTLKAVSSKGEVHEYSPPR